MALLRSALVALTALGAASCDTRAPGFDTGTDLDGSIDGSRDASLDVRGDTPTDRPDVTFPTDVNNDVILNPDAACATASAITQVEKLPVDIIWVVDNSTSMAPAIDQVIAGLNTFAGLVGQRGLDYRVIMLSLRNKTPNVTVSGGARYAVCIPPPLAGDTNCGNGTRFLHSSVDIRSTQPLEQLLGTLGQTLGYTPGMQRGGDPWQAFLRPNATKSVVVVSDDDTRLMPDEFEHLRNGTATSITNPYNANFELPPGILEPTWNGMFTGYTFNAIYGWGSATDPSVSCRFSNGTLPAKPGLNYTTLVARTSGVRAKICDGATAWTPFFNDIATAVERTARVACDVPVPAPPDGSVIDPSRVNVALLGTTRTLLGKVSNMAACSTNGGWYFDNNTRPTRVFLCPVSCDRAQTELRGTSRGVEVLFGCQSIPG